MSDLEQTTPEADAPAQPTDRLAELEAECRDLKDRWVRAEAEMQNVRNRAKREVEDARAYAVQKFATDVAESAENLRRGLAALPPRLEAEADVLTNLRDGFAGVERAFLAMLERHGVKGTDPTGQAFDPDRHQAMGEQETDQHPPGTIVQAWTNAWTLNGRLIRPAMVIVAKAPAKAADHGHIDTTA